MTRHDAKGGVRRSLVNVEAAPDAEHDAEQEQRKRDAGDRQETAPLVAKGGLGDETCEGHGDENSLHLISSPVETGLAPSHAAVRDAASRVSTGKYLRAWTGETPVAPP